MFRIHFIILLAMTMSAMAEPSSVPPTKHPVLKALPLGGDEDELSKPSPALAAKPLTAVKPAPSVEPPKRALPVNAVAKPALPVEPVKPLPSTTLASPLTVRPTGDDAVRLQIFLDEAKFGPGVIDGRPGQFTDLAVQSWNEVNGYPLSDWVAVNTAARKAVPNPTAVALVPDFVNEWVDANLPTEYERLAKAKRMSYRSVAEFVAERYHCDIPYLEVLNGAAKIAKLKPRDPVIVPNVTPFRIETLTGAKYEADPVLSQRHVVVDTKINQARIFAATPAALVVDESGTNKTAPPRANRGLIASFPITPGKPKFIKFGIWELRNMIELPWWRYDKKLLETGVRSNDALNIPSGPNSPVGVIWNGTSKPGIGMHGTASPETIGRARSAGCIRLANWDAVRLPTLIRPGATVEIR